MRKVIIIFFILCFLAFIIYLISTKNYPIIFVNGDFIPAKDYFLHKKSFDHLKINSKPENLTEDIKELFLDKKLLKKVIFKKLIDSKIYEKEVKRLNLYLESEKKLQEYLNQFPETFITEIEASYGLDFDDFKRLVLRPFFQREVLNEKINDLDNYLNSKKSVIIILPWAKII